MIVITFPDDATETRGLGFLMTHFSGRVLAGGIHVVPEAAVEALAAQGISFTVKGKATYEQQVAPVQILLPLRFNDGSDVPPDWFGEAAKEIRAQFGAVSYETQKIEGQWSHGGAVYHDTLVKIVVDLPDTASNRRWMKAYRDRWKLRLNQIELWLVSYLISID